MIKISKIERSNRKTLSISITPQGEVVVKAPLRLPMADIEKFLQEKRPWIESKVNRINKIQDKFSDIISYKKLMVLGESYYGYSSNNCSKITLENDRILIPTKIQPEKLHKKVTNWYQSYADAFLIPRTQEVAKLLNLMPTKIKCTGSRGRWGACNSEGELFLNWRCVMLPPKLIDYVIVHELAHLLELNHSPKFWAEVERVLPDYKIRRRELKSYGVLLKLF